MVLPEANASAIWFAITPQPIPPHLRCGKDRQRLREALCAALAASCAHCSILARSTLPQRSATSDLLVRSHIYSSELSPPFSKNPQRRHQPLLTGETEIYASLCVLTKDRGPSTYGLFARNFYTRYTQVHLQLHSPICTKRWCADAHASTSNEFYLQRQGVSYSLHFKL